MCEYQRIEPYAEKPTMPVCVVTGELCTLCVFGKAETYNKAKESEAKIQKCRQRKN